MLHSYHLCSHDMTVFDVQWRLRPATKTQLEEIALFKMFLNDHMNGVGIRLETILCLFSVH